MICEEIRTLLDAYSDHELDVVRALEIESHLAECATCPREYERRVALKSAVKGNSLYYPPPPNLEGRIRGALGRSPAAPTEVRPAIRRSNASFWRPLAMAASVAFVVLATWFAAARLSSPSQDDVVVRELIASHVRSLMANHLTDVASTDQHTVKPWFDGRVDYSPPVADFAAQNFPLVGGRLDYIEGRPVAAIVYKRRRHIINLFIWPTSQPPTAEEQKLSRKGYHLIHWTRAGLDYWAISNIDSRELDDFARLAQGETP